MTIERKEPLVEITLDVPDRDYWATRPYVSSELRPAIQAADLVLVPHENWRDYEEPLFPAGTSDFGDCIKDVSPSTSVEVCVDEDKYKEIALHADVIYVVAILAQFLFAPVAVQVIAEYIKRRLPLGSKSAEVKAKITLELTEGERRRAATIEYDGPAAQFESTMRTAVEVTQNRLNTEASPQLPPAPPSLGEDGKA